MHVFAALAEFERALIRERTAAGLRAARDRGRVGGRPPVMTGEKLVAARRLKASGMAAREVASAVGVSLPTGIGISTERWMLGSSPDGTESASVLVWEQER